jgi:hypothetical protein
MTVKVKAEESEHILAFRSMPSSLKRRSNPATRRDPKQPRSSHFTSVSDKLNKPFGFVYAVCFDPEQRPTSSYPRAVIRCSN